VVVEIGAGLGTYSFFAARSGARRVYGIEREGVIRVAEELAARNGLAGHITFVRGDSTEVVLPEKADVLVLEDFSSLFLRRGLEEVVRDALDRHLREGGIVIPQAVSLCIAPVGDAALWKGLLNLEDESYRLYGLDLGLLRQMMLDNPHVRAIEAQSLLADPVIFKTIELKQAQSYLFDEVVAVKIVRSGTMYGLAGWFDLTLTPDVVLSNAPANPESVWRQVFFPFSNPLTVTEGETVTLRLSCARSSGTRDIWWTWQAAAASGSAFNCSFQGIPFRADQQDARRHRPCAGMSS
jgi:protein arginine N-methyltransferase 1